ncbi:hypothetical protein GCM10009120_50090 [Sphingobacterium siyangense subsp. cladoniae]|uniref:HD domain-containing protein n=1 Tax=Sphingobacterium siyangense TaxID=459529 RepID=UPI0031F78DE1
MRVSNIYKKSFDKTIFSDSNELIDKLLEEIKISEENLKHNLEMIRVDFPGLTDHSLNHSKMLWNYTQLIVGDNISLNPLEAYILHMCFLVHDAGMCFSILDNKSDIEATDIYKDFVAINQNIENVEEEALFYSVRKLHGEFAFVIPSAQLPSGKMVINDEELRDEFCEMIGKISKSHSMDISYIDNELSIYTNPNYIDFPIDCRKLAFILRVADAAHIDNLRTPLLNSEIEASIKGVSKDHWVFQKKIGFPLIESGLLVYNSVNSFTVNERKAWWLCFDALSVLNDELKKANMFFSERNEKGFLARGVKAIDNPFLLGESYIRTIGWQSIDTKVKVSRPNLLAANVGGKRLYNYSYVSIRELIQNSIDAINLRQLKQSGFVGKIVVEVKEECGNWYLSVKDNGIGMSRSLLINHLLDFGRSYWHSYDFYDDYLGIAQRKFKSIGQFGIGFYSVFMLGNEVNVCSTKFGEDVRAQNVLVFENGLIENPSLMVVENRSLESEYGTIVKIKLFHNPYELNGFIDEISFQNNDLFSLIKYLIPDSDHLIEVVENDTINVIHKNGLSNCVDLNFNNFINDNIFQKKNETKNYSIDKLKELNRKLLPIYQDGEIIGQLALIPNINRKSIMNTGIVISNGIRVAELSENISGFIKVSTITNLNRNQYKADITYQSFFDWAVRYIEYLKSLPQNPDIFGDIEKEIKGIQYSFGILDDEEYVFVYCDTEIDQRIPLTSNSLRSLIRCCDEFNHYQLMDTFHDGFHYKGIFDVIRPFAFGSFVQEEAREKILSISSLINKLLKEEWGEFKKVTTNCWNDFDDLPGNSYPYFTKEVYTKIIQ